MYPHRLTDVKKTDNPLDMEKTYTTRTDTEFVGRRNAYAWPCWKEEKRQHQTFQNILWNLGLCQCSFEDSKDFDAGEEEWNQFVEELRKRKG